MKSRSRTIGTTPSGSLMSEMCSDAVNIESREIALDEFGNVFDRAEQFDVMPHDVDHAAALQARRTLLSPEAHGNGEHDLGAFRQPHEIDMHRPVGNRVELHVARDHAGALSVQRQHERGGEESAGADMPLKLALGDGDGGRRRIAAIHDAGDQPLLADPESGAFAGLRARFDAQFLGFTHGRIPCFRLFRPAGDGS